MQISELKIPGNGYKLAATLFTPQKSQQKLPAVIFYHGMISQRKPRMNKRAQKVAEKGIVCLTFDFRGCGESDGKLGELSIHDWFDDALLAFDYLRGLDIVDPRRIGVTGKSFGGYITALVSGERNIKSIAVQAPGLYKDSWFDIKYDWDDKFKQMRWEYRRSKDALNNNAIKAIKKYRNSLLVIGSENDDFCPKSSVEGYFNSAGSADKQLVWIKGADHPLTNEIHNEEYTNLMSKWFVKTL